MSAPICKHCGREAEPDWAEFGGVDPTPAKLCGHGRGNECDTVRLIAEIARLAAELADARKPRWALGVDESMLIVGLRDVAVVTWRHDIGWLWKRTRSSWDWVVVGTEAEAKAAAERAAGVEDGL